MPWLPLSLRPSHGEIHGVAVYISMVRRLILCDTRSRAPSLSHSSGSCSSTFR